LHGTLELPEPVTSTTAGGPVSNDAANDEAGGDDSTLVEHSGSGLKDMATEGEEPLHRLPKSNSSYDLRSSAQTPKASDGKLGLSRESLNYLLSDRLENWTSNWTAD
jgi:hypothetical protein